MLRTPLTLFHASFLPICSTFSHLSLLIFQIFSKRIPPLRSQEQDPQALVGAARVRGARAGERRRRKGAAAVRPEGSRPGGPHRHRKWGRRGQVRHTESAHRHACSINQGRVFVRPHRILSATSHFSASPPRFIIPGDFDLDDAPYEDFLSHDEELERKKERESRRRGELLAKVDFSRYAGSRSLAAFTHCGAR